jgi:hypothetical protein
MSTDIHILAEQAAAQGILTAEQVCNRFLQAITRSQSYLERRRRRGTLTAYDQALALDCATMARAIILLQEAS